MKFSFALVVCIFSHFAYAQPFLLDTLPNEQSKQIFAWGACEDNNGNIYMSGSDIYKIDKHGDIINEVDAANAISIKYYQGKLYATARNAVIIYDTLLNELLRINSFSNTEELAIDSDGNIFVWDLGTEKVLIYNSNGAYNDFWSLEGHRGSHMYFDADDNLYLLNNSNETLVYSKNGDPIDTITQSSDQQEIIFDIKAFTYNKFDHSLYYYISRKIDGRSINSVIRSYNLTNSEIKDYDVQNLSVNIVDGIRLFASENENVIFAMDIIDISYAYAYKLTFDLLTGLDNEISFSPGNFYPNPVNDRLYIKDKTVSMTLYDHTGKQYIIHSENGDYFDLSDFSNGLYSLRYETSNDVYVGHFMKN